MGYIRWGRVFRRGLAVCLATVTLWLLAGTAGSLGPALAESGAFVTAALRVELGSRGQGGPGFWEGLALGQSLLLAKNLTGPEPGTEPPVAILEPLPNAQPAPDRKSVV